MLANKKRKICVFSGKRGGFGAYVPLMKLIENDPKLQLQILLGDMHVAKKFGNTIKEVRRLFPKANIKVIEMGTGRGDSPVIRTENLGVCLQKSAKILQALKPDIVMIHADRGEHLIIALAALNLGIPVTHSQGGDISGNIDDIQRHAITKLSHIHFLETKEAAGRLKKMGEESWRVHNVGSLYIDRIARKMYTPFPRVRKKYGLKKNEDYFIIIFHPDTFESRQTNYEHARNLFKAIKLSCRRSFVIYPCSDPGYEGVLKAIKEIEKDEQFLVYKNIDNLDFLSLMSCARILLGNSSSALVEAPYFKLPAINIGRRQQGRDREANVVDARPAAKNIKNKIDFVLTNKSFRSQLRRGGYRLGDGRAAEKIIKILKTVSLDEKLLRKKITY
ncbi:UDP-N-acetylglucosamine 2-epimerase (hydrolyzing) [Candidatus Falkowbacteria bacterium CG10_big_fil_rev_8_21_14_0_10_43_10]|uniref:UDP-N-acetylglucosamine 2-epimerase (Hydrolyzing) n=1 Tax=Candidatus Falkowbacteria bacterium CG10_big_fil_rev_8_21_14_0_10_43_10 TaxID=1974567 RepID=A0A2H0V473_9BACT|nr:MAG: UDP-N-acetylglucosamine 2-epimerase (hydrolyzing) [Candidatus Falkowbacteria bacterium CG10_big_fil_rev_8_21_14_0_10_43_10]